MLLKTKKQPLNSFANSGLYLLLIVSAVYLGLYHYFPGKTLDALLESVSILLHLLPVFFLVITLMSILTALINAKKMAQLLAVEHGAKSWLLAVVGGVFSHGSSFIWYQLLANLRDYKVNECLLMTFLYARAIKLPWLPLMVSYFGYAFTGVLMFYIMIAALAQGLIAQKIMRHTPE